MIAHPAHYQAALYLRLSKDDEGFGESASITNQRNLLIAYAGSHGYCIVSEYVDDGYSGTSFDRPAFLQMLKDIEQKKINLILTKDLSRLGRDYIQTGQYTEVYFPSKKVRCIAVNDGFDSESANTDLSPFQHVINEMYARDISKKIRSAFFTKMQNGSYIGNFAPYGYRKDPEDHNHLLPDEAAAAVVRQIFALAADGAKPAEIARHLNDHQVLPPALYRCSLFPRLDPDHYSKNKQWSAASITKLLRNVVYLGHTAQGKTSKISFKSDLTLRNAPEDWVVVENTHPPLVDPSLFELVQRRVKSRACEKKGRFCNMFSGLARCAACGRSMSTVGTRKKGSLANLVCGGYKLCGTKMCSSHSIDYNTLCQIVWEAVQEQLQLTPSEREALVREVSSRSSQPHGEISTRGEQERLNAELKKLDRIIEQLYDDHLREKISLQRFSRLLQKYEEQSAELHRRLEALTAEENTPRESTPDPLISPLERLEQICKPSADLLFSLIEHIEVEQGYYEKTEGRKIRHQEIRIYFRFSVLPQSRELLVWPQADGTRKNLHPCAWALDATPPALSAAGSSIPRANG